MMSGFIIEVLLLVVIKNFIMVSKIIKFIFLVRLLMLLIILNVLIIFIM